MAEPNVLDVQHGIWLDADWLEKAGLGSHIQVIVYPGEIQIRSASSESSVSENSEEGWDIFLSLESGITSPGKLHNASINHDQYLYTKDS